MPSCGASRAERIDYARRVRLVPVLAALVIGGLVSCRTTPPDAGPVPPPDGATRLFDRAADVRKRDGTASGWKLDGGVLTVSPGDGDAVSAQELGDGRLHVEFNLPRTQPRASSGVYLMGRWKVQVLDCWENETYDDATCGALYGLVAPATVAPKRPEHWQTYDIDFRAPRADASGLVTTAGRITVVHNGTTIIEDASFDRTTKGGIDETIVSRGPVLLQERGTAVRFRNVWFVPGRE